MKDNFSEQAAQYAQYRPGYPPALFEYLAGLSPARSCAWDCATGNGQMALGLSAFFDRVYATDISEKQLAHAVKAPNITYLKEPAEAPSFAACQFDLAVAGQAIHWFDFGSFYREVRRTLKPGGVFAAAGYGLPRISPEVDGVLTAFYLQEIGPYWDPERRYVDEGYRTIPFPFREVKPPGFHYKVSWELPQLAGYVSTWSAVQHYPF